MASVCKDQLILSTHIDLISVQRPAIAFYAGKELAGDPTSWCGPNVPALKAMLRTVGFDRMEVAASSPLPERYDIEEVYPGWATVHAWKAAPG